MSCWSSRCPSHQECGPLEEEGMVHNVLDRSFDVLFHQMGIIKRVYLEVWYQDYIFFLAFVFRNQTWPPSFAATALGWSCVQARSQGPRVGSDLAGNWVLSRAPDPYHPHFHSCELSPGVCARQSPQIQSKCRPHVFVLILGICHGVLRASAHPFPFFTQTASSLIRALVIHTTLSEVPNYRHLK